MAAQAMPPSTPQTSTAGSSSGPCTSGSMTGRIDPQTAPTVYCPSAPMFQTLVRKTRASPTPMSASGVALTTISSSDQASVSGLTK